MRTKAQRSTKGFSARRGSRFTAMRFVGFRLLRYRVHGLSFVVAAAILLSAGHAQAQESKPGHSETSFVRDGRLDLDAVVDHFEDLYRSNNSKSRAKFTITKPRRTRTLTMDVWTKGEEKSLIIIRSPAREKGTATLKVDKNLWNYLPRIKRTIRVPPSMMLGSWMGSDFTNDDLVRESSFREDYTYELVGRSQDTPGWLIRFRAKPDMVGLWKRFELVVSKDGTIPVVARYYDRKDRLARTLHWDQVGSFDGRRIPARMMLIPEDKEGHSTEMVYLDMKFDIDVPDSTFSLSKLEQHR